VSPFESTYYPLIGREPATAASWRTADRKDWFLALKAKIGRTKAQALEKQKHRKGLPLEKRADLFVL